ncbi:UDP-N-acetylglucosamine 2-epimerase (non-hydrolyzing) [candidate division WOR-3 bacterium]|nr:UDP-N-acetylglucosamine 2-epimerase (non-hydrolyzing) [candidate division WOR-3 bacterium]
MKKTAIVAGARPNFMKIAPVLRELKSNNDDDFLLVHTGQHYDYLMSEVFFKELGIREPDAFLGAGSGSHAEQTAKVMTSFEKWCFEKNPGRIVVAGDVNSTMACAIAGAKISIPVAHIESGLRSFDKTMPEEINRIVTDQLSALLFTTCMEAEINLKRENTFGNIHFVGNPMIDSLIYISEKLDGKTLDDMGLDKREYCLVTLHRPANVDDRENLENLSEILNGISEIIKVVFPVHPRTLKNLEYYGFKEKLKNVLMTKPLGYKNFIELEKNAKFVLTDSGGVQEETTYFMVPCLTLRPNTERPVTVTEGTNELCDLDKTAVLEKVRIIIGQKWKKGSIPDFWDGNAGSRIACILADW